MPPGFTAGDKVQVEVEVVKSLMPSWLGGKGGGQVVGRLLLPGGK